MKPLWLEISAFGPFGKKAVVPFEKLGEGGLYLITGNTGAGKTTIFDAICFVLYGEASGSVRTTDLMRSDFAQADDKTYVKMGFSHHGKYYEIHRSPKYQRPKKNGKGVTAENADALLVKDDGSQIIGYRTVTEAIEELLSIDVKQFKQIVMIAQGEFLKLLIADSTERGQILRKVFHTASFLNMQLRLKEEEKKLRVLWEELEKSILQYLEGMTYENDCEHAAFLEDNKTDIYKTDELLQALNCLIHQDTEALKELNQNQQTLEKEYSHLSEMIAVAEYENNLFAQKEAALKKLKELTQQESEIEQLHQKAMVWQKARIHVYPADKLLEREQEQLHMILLSIEKLMAEKADWEKKFAAAKEKYEEQKKNQPIIEELSAKVKKAQEALPLYEEFTMAQNNLDRMNREIASYEKLTADWAIKKQKIIEEIQAVEKNMEAVKDAQTQLVIVQNTCENTLHLQAKAKQLTDDFAQIANGKLVYIQKQKKYRELEAEYVKNREASSQAELLFLQAQAGILADTLMKNSPCPVCGSLEHPHKAVLPVHFKTQAEVEELKRVTQYSQNKLQKQAEQLSSENARLKASFYEIKRQAEELFPAMAEVDSKNYSDFFALENTKLHLDVSRLREEIIKIQSDVKNYEKLNVRFAELKEQKQFGEQYAEEYLIKQNKLLESIGSVKGTLQALASQLPFSSKQQQQEQLERYIVDKQLLEENLTKAEVYYQQTKEGLTSTSILLEQGNKNLDKQNLVVQGTNQKFYKALKEHGFASKENYQLHIKSMEEIETARNDVVNFRLAMNECKSQLARLNEAVKEKIPVDMESLKAKCGKLKILVTENKAMQENIIIRYKNNENIWKRAGQAWKTRKELEGTYAMVRDLSRTANGELTGKDKVAFEQYVQSFYFERIIYAANERLSKLTNQRYALLHKQGAENRKSQSGLELEIMDYYTGKARSVKTLSGGEAFKASLSLALGLSDVIQHSAGGIQIDAMFIDEGFGTLDEESLEQAVGALWDLAYGKRLVGVISHMSELKEQIDKKIYVHKGQSGSSVAINLI